MSEILKKTSTFLKLHAMQKVENEKVNEWVKNKAKTTYIKISGDFQKCHFSMMDIWKR